MKENSIVESTIKFVKSELENAEGGHDWWHAWRVWKITCKLLETENADRLVCEPAALLHDIADPKFHDGNEDAGPTIAFDFLIKQGLDHERSVHVIDIIRNVSFKGGYTNDAQKSVELQIVQDADRLDAMGAIGIARAFSYGGYKGRKLYDPDIAPRSYASTEEYRKSNAPTLNHFYEKLLLLKNLMNTKTASLMAEHRHSFMLSYLEEFRQEWDGFV
jgi:uncharacterized protein